MVLDKIKISSETTEVVFLNNVRFVKLYLTYKIIDAESNYFSEGYMVAET